MTSSSSHVACSGSADFRLSYVTDVEGNLAYFMRFVERNSVLRFDGQQLDLVDDSPNCYFVYGGDVVDKNSGDIRLCRLLVDLKTRYPSNVELLVGNRDLNKLRLSAELAEVGERPLQDIPGPHWDSQAPTLQEYLANLPQSTTDDDSACTDLQHLDTRVNRLKYMLLHTLGCPNTFEFRRQELQILQGPGQTISDEQVVDSFLYQVEHGSLWQYLNLAKVAVCIGNTLFCHGAVDRRTMKFIPNISSRFCNPPAPGPGAYVESLPEWIDGLNQLLKSGLEDHKKRPYWNNDRSSRGGEALMALQNRSAMWGRSIISNCYGDGGCITTCHAPQLEDDSSVTDPLAFEGICSDPADPMVAQWLKTYGIQRVVVGHKPTGDCPAVLSASFGTGVEIVSADTSYSDPSAVDNRGASVSVVEIIGASNVDNHLECSGLLHDGMEHHSVFARLSVAEGIDESVGDHRLGTEHNGEWWVKASLTSKADHFHCRYHLTRGNGRHVEYQRTTI